MSSARSVGQWLRQGKIWIFRTFALIVAASIALSRVPSFSEYALSTDRMIFLIFIVLWLLMEIFLDGITSMESTQKEGIILDWHSCVNLFREEVGKASDVVILARSGEMSYHALRDILDKRRDSIKVDVYQVRLSSDGQQVDQYQALWKDTWVKNLGPCINSERLVYSSADLGLGAVIVNRRIGYLGYSVHRSTQPYNHTRYSIRVTSDSQYGRYLLDLYNQWIKHHSHVPETGELTDGEISVPSAGD